MKTKDQLADIGTKHLSKQRQCYIFSAQVDPRIQGLKLRSLDDQQKRKPLRFDRLTFSISDPEFADQLEEIALPLLAEMLGANVSKLVLCLHIFDGGSALLD